MKIQNLNHKFIKTWEASSDNFPHFNTISLNEKKFREEEMVQFSKNLKSEVDLRKLDNETRKQFIQKFQLGFKRFFEQSFGFSEAESSLVTRSGLFDITKQFMHMARRFDANVNIEDVFQASRNLWIINSLQIMMQAEVKLSNSIFAYSMLYPYSDNYLDDPAISSKEKVAFSKRFRQRLKGEYVIAANDNEQRIFDLVGLIETDWSRKDNPGVYDSLLAIHDAQTKSIGLVNHENELSYDELLLLCVEKGGTSVLADGYLINGKLTPNEEAFCYGFGAFLQFVDDIQDIEEDTNGELQTLFTHAAKSKCLEQYVNKAIDFGKQVMGDLSCFGEVDLSNMSSLMVKSNLVLLTEAVGLNSQYYSKDYVINFEKYSAFRYEFVRKRRSNMESNRISLMNKLSSFIFDDKEIAAMQA